MLQVRKIAADHLENTKKLRGTVALAAARRLWNQPGPGGGKGSGQACGCDDRAALSKRKTVEYIEATGLKGHPLQLTRGEKAAVASERTKAKKPTKEETPEPAIGRRPEELASSGGRSGSRDLASPLSSPQQGLGNLGTLVLTA